ncbi:putative signal peptidase I [Rosa chinensis]|uniref:Putative signal peptidase I n=1 Tax=Rosa chinensis TaxID=74649 RepID=A0A2P6PHG8_ROSCH|nr:putative signal peptidase I [Rosa chinensis]
MLLEFLGFLWFLSEKVSYLLRKPEVSYIVIFKAPPILQNFVICVVDTFSLGILCNMQEIGFSSGDVFIKRIVARGGDYVEVHDGKLLVNGEIENEDNFCLACVWQMHPQSRDVMCLMSVNVVLIVLIIHPQSNHIEIEL